MDALEEKLGSILNDPQTMQKLMHMAQSLGAAGEPGGEEAGPALQDMASLQKLSGLARQGSIDREQQALLNALSPYLSRQRIRKLENAMRAAKMAKLASRFFGTPQGNLRSAR